MYKVEGNKVRKMPEIEKPTDTYCGHDEFYSDWREDWNKYELELSKQPTFPISGSHPWKEGDMIEEGKDFEFGHHFPMDEQQARELTPEEKKEYKAVFPLATASTKYAIPILSGKEEVAGRIRKMAWQSFKDRGLTVFVDDIEPMKGDIGFCFYEQGFSDAFDHILKIAEKL